MAERHLIDGDMASRREHVFAKLEASRKQRNAAVAARVTGGSCGEAAEEFWAKFHFLSSELDSDMDAALSKAGHSVDPVAAERCVVSWTEQMAALRKLIADASLALPTYDAEKAQKSFAAVQASFEEARAKLSPRRKFRFSDKARARLRARQDAKASAAARRAASGAAAEQASRSEAAMAALADEEVTVAGRTGETIVLGGEGSHGESAKGRDLRLAELSDCIVIILHTTRAIRVDGLTNCVVYTGAVAGSVLLHKCSGCTLMLASRQIRLHTSAECDFYLHVHSRPIIEHCTQLRFAPYPLTHPSLGADLQAAGLKQVGGAGVAHLWREVDDFGWHKVQASPNWSVLPSAQRATASAHSSFSVDWAPHAEYVSGAFDAPPSTTAEGAGNKKEDTQVQGGGAPPPDPPTASVEGGAAADGDSEGESDDEL